MRGSRTTPAALPPSCGKPIKAVHSCPAPQTMAANNTATHGLGSNRTAATIGGTTHKAVRIRSLGILIASFRVNLGARAPESALALSEPGQRLMKIRGTEIRP